MGTGIVVGRLAVKGIRHRPGQALLLLLALVAATSTLTVGLALRGATDTPYARTRAATRGPDLVAVDQPAPDGDAASPGALVPLEHTAGVVAHSGPFPVSWSLLRTGNTTTAAEIEGRAAAPSPVDQPKVLEGTWIRPGGVVVEAGFAEALGLHVGAPIDLGNRTFRVVGIAVTAALPSYLQLCYLGCWLANELASYNPGLVWVPQRDVAGLAGGGEPVEYFLNLKLAHPAAAPAVAHGADATASLGAPTLSSWQDIRQADAKVIGNVQLVLYTGSGLLALLALASVAVLVGGRMTEQTRRVGLLKAVGATPAVVAAMLLCENVLVGFGAAAVGLVVGWLAAPLILGPGAGLLGATTAPVLTGATVGLVLGLALAVSVLATFVPAVRAARRSTVAALEESVRVPRRRGSVIRLSAYLPPSLLLGARLAVRRPRRLVLNVFSVAVTASGLGAVLVLRATSGGWSLGPQMTEATTIVSAMLVTLAAVNAVFVAWATTLDARHAAALARALGATPAEITTGLTVAQLLPALVGAVLGIPGGIGVYDAAKNGGSTTVPPFGWFVVMVVVTLAVVSVLTAIPARIGARRPVAEVLGAETA